MAVTQIHTIETTLKTAIDYICNPEKTDDNILVSGFNCTPEMAAFDFEFTKKTADSQGGRLAYHMIQSFAPGEVDYNTAHELGKGLADEFLQGKYEYVISTHIDRGHVHNHIIFNSVSFEDNKKFHGDKNIFKRMADISDKLCMENGLSVIDEPKQKGKSYTEYEADKRGESFKSKLRQTVDECVLKASDWNDFIRLIQEREYEIKQGKHISFRAKGQERFTRLKTLGAYYAEDKIKERIGNALKTVSTGNADILHPKADHDIKNIIDVENNEKAKNSAGFKHWAQVNNLKMAAQTLMYAEENGLLNPAALKAKYDDLKGKNESARTGIKEVENKIKTLDEKIKAIDNYRKYKPIVEAQNDFTFKEKYQREHETEFILFNAAKQSLKIHFGNEKLPPIKTLRAEMNALYTEKNNLYSDYYSSKNELKELSVIKNNMDKYFGSASDIDKQTERDNDIRHKNKGNLE